MREILL